MELTILKHLPMPDVAVRMVTQFLRKPHPTAAMIKALTFTRCSNGFSVHGEALRYHKMNTYPPTYCRGNVAAVIRMHMFCFDMEDGEFDIESDDGQGLTIDEMREMGMTDNELTTMGYDITEGEESEIESTARALGFSNEMLYSIMETAGRNSFRALGFSDDELSAMGYEITN